jgi:sulfate permease, SulP family
MAANDPVKPDARAAVWRARAERIAPGIAWMRAYRLADLGHDALAGATLAAVILPIAMAYGRLAGLPPIAGVYTSLAPLVAYAIFGQSRLLVLGPDTSTAALVAAAVLPLAAGSVSRALALAAALALLVGALALIASVARLGFIASFLSRPILTGYINGLALTVITGQLAGVFGVPISGADVFTQLASLARQIGQTNLPTLAVGAGVIALILTLRWFAPRVPGALIAVAGATLVVGAFSLKARGVATIGAIPPGLPAPRLPAVSLADLGALLPDALGITLLTFSDTILNARVFAARNGYSVDANRELAGMGAGNIAASLTQGFPVSASGTRTAVNEAAGARTPLAGIVAAATLGLILLVLTEPMSQFPIAALGGALIAIILPLIDIAAFRQLYLVRRADFAVALVTLVGVITIGLLPGLAIAVALSFLLVLARAVRPHDAVLGKTPGLDGYHDVDDYPESARAPGLLLYRFDGPLFFANASYFQSRLTELIEGLDPPLRWLILDAEAITDIDSTALETLEEVRRFVTERGATLAVARAKSSLRGRLERAGLVASIGSGHFYPSIRTSVAGYEEEISATRDPTP